MLPSGFDLDQITCFRESISKLNRTLSASHQPSSIYIHAPSNSGLITAIVRNRLDFYSPREFDEPSVQDLLPKVITIDLKEVCSPRLIYDRILNLLSNWSNETEMDWNEEIGLVENWNGRQEGLTIESNEERPSKRVKLNVQDDSRDSIGSKWRLEWDREVSRTEWTGVRNDCLDSWYQGLREIFTLGGESTEREQRRYILFENAGHIEDLASGSTNGAPKETGIGMTFAGALSRLGELSRTTITTVLISPVSWTKARGALIGTLEPQVISFTDSLNRQDVVYLLSARFEASSPVSTSLNKTALVQLFQDLVSLLHDTFTSQVGDHLDELAFLTAKFWPRWLGFVESGRLKPENVSQLGAFLKEDLTKEIERLADIRLPLYNSSASTTVSTATTLPGFTGIMPDLPTPIASGSNSNYFSPPITPNRKRPMEELVQLNNSPTKLLITASDQSLAASLPLLSKFLLIASYFASFNSAKSDVIHFVRLDEGIAKKGTKAKKASARKPGTLLKAKLTQDKLGPKIFPLERLLAIFQAILVEAVPEAEYAAHSVDVLMLITTLVNLRLLSRTSTGDKALDGIKFKCKVDRDTIEMLARSVGYKEWTTYLMNEEV